MHSRRPAHQQGSNRPQAIFYFVREEPTLLTGVRAADIVEAHLKIAVEENPDRFKNFVGIVEDDAQVPEKERAMPRRTYSLDGQVVRMARPAILETLREKLSHLRIPGAPSYRAPRYHTAERCVVYVGSPAYLLFHARHNLEETGVLRQKWGDFSVVAYDLVPYSACAGTGRPSYLHIDCFEAEKFNSDNFDEVARRLGLGRKSRRRSPGILTGDEMLQRIGQPLDEDEEELCEGR